MTVFEENGRIWRSQTGESWQDVSWDGGVFSDCAYGNNTFVGYAEGLYYSIAGVQWEEGEDSPWMESSIRAITF